MGTHVEDASILLDERQRKAAQSFLNYHESAEFSRIGMRDPSGKVHVLPDDLARLVSQILTTVARGGRFKISPIPEEMTSTQAAKMLGVSRPTLMKLVRSGELPHRQEGTHVRIAAEDLLTLRRERLKKQREAFEALRDLPLLPGEVDPAL